MRRRIFLALLALLLLTIMGSWFVTGPQVLIPLKKELIRSRADVVLTIAKELEESKSPRVRLKRLQKSLKVKAKLVREDPQLGRKNPLRRFEREGHTMMLFPGRKTPLAVALEGPRGPLWLVVSFPVDLEQPGKNIGFGLLIVLMGSIIGALLLTRWSLMPLHSATKAMHRMAEGELSHRIDDQLGGAGLAFNQMADRIEGLITGQRHLVAAISHELRTPLTRLRLQAEVLELNDRQRSLLQQDITELDNLIETLLVSSKLESGSFALRKEAVNLWELLLEVLAKIDLEERELKLEVPDSLEFSADRLLMARVMLNVLSNIGRYTPNDCSVSITARSANEELHLTISDTGAGVPDSQLDSLFKPFWRAEQSRAKHTGGYGLGLMLVQQVINAHGGRATARNNTPTGLAIELSLPETSENV